MGEIAYAAIFGIGIGISFTLMNRAKVHMWIQGITDALSQFKDNIKLGIVLVAVAVTYILFRWWRDKIQLWQETKKKQNDLKVLQEKEQAQWTQVKQEHALPDCLPLSTFLDNGRTMQLKDWMDVCNHNLGQASERALRMAQKCKYKVDPKRIGGITLRSGRQLREMSPIE